MSKPIVCRISRRPGFRDFVMQSNLFASGWEWKITLQSHDPLFRDLFNLAGDYLVLPVQILGPWRADVFDNPNIYHFLAKCLYKSAGEFKRLVIVGKIDYDDHKNGSCVVYEESYLLSNPLGQLLLT